MRLLQLRAKNLSARDYLAATRLAIGATAILGARVIVNDRPDIAAVAGAAGVHVGQEDMDVEAARVLCPAPSWVGISTHNEAQLAAAVATSADYIAVGPVFTTRTKEHPDPVVGLELVRRARAMTHKPIVAIGGITAETAAGVYAAGADSVAVISDICDATYPADRAAQYLEVAKRAMAARI